MTVESGETVVIDTISHEGILEDQGSNPVAYFGRHGVAGDQVLDDAREVAARRRRDPDTDGPHIVTGPIAVAGARPGDILAIHIDALQMRAPYGVISSRHGRGVRTGNADLDDATFSQYCEVRGTEAGWVASLPRTQTCTAETPLILQLDPFLGIMGVASDTEHRLHSVPPGTHGGNIDVRRLTEGATLYLPVQVPDALFYVGDPHFAQGNGEVALTALEAPLRATVTLEIVTAAQIGHRLDKVSGPFATAHGLLIPTGMDVDLGRALELCVGNAIELLVALFDTDPRQAYLYLSAAADFNVSQAVDIVRGVHGEIRLADLMPHDGSELTRLLLADAR